MKRSKNAIRFTTAAFLVSCGLFLVLGTATPVPAAYHLRQQPAPTLISSTYSVRVPLSSVYSPGDRFTPSLAGALLALFVALFSVQYGVGRRHHIDPLDAIQRKAEEIALKAGLGNGHKVPPSLGRELQELAAELNTMIQALDAARNGKEARFRERTAELVHANERQRKEIQERLGVERRLRESEERFRLLTEQSPDAVIMLDAEGLVLFANPSAESLFGIERSRLQGSHFGFPLAGQKSAEIEVPRMSGETARAEMRVVETRLNKEPVYIASLRDITERKSVEASLSRLATAIEHAAESVHVTDMDGNILFANPAFERITGYSREEVEGMWAGLLRPRNRPKEIYCTMWNQVRAGRTWSGNLQGAAKDGGRFEVAASISPVKDTEGEITNAVMVMRDVGQEMALERQLRQAQKMEAIGTLAGGIAHDFNNVLSVILGYAELTQQNLPEQSDDRENLREVILAARRARDLIKQILAFSRQSEEEFQPIQLHLIVKEAFKLLRSSLPSSIEMQQSIRKCRPTMGDPTQLYQVVMNLCTNASQAMSEKGGTLFLGLDEVDLNEDEAAERDLGSPGAYVKLTVKDSGNGISPAILDRIFEPYFTTKEKGKGTGLGLSVVHGIVKAHGGSIAVESRLGEGTGFFVFFPATDSKADESGHGDAELHVRGGNERILLVDDEGALVNLIRQVLEGLGYQVDAFTDSVQALERFRADPGLFDLVITDLTMPGLSGDRLVEEMLSLRPSLPVILCTGYSERVDGPRARALGVRAFMFKPLSSSNLSETVRRVLDEEGTAR